MVRRPRWPGWRRAWQELIGSNASNRQLAAAMALGALVAPTPVLGLHTWMAIGLALLCRLNPLAAFVGSNLSNPLTVAPLVWLDILIGARLLGRHAPSWPGREHVWGQLASLYLEAWIGSLALGAALALLVYVAAALALPRLRRAQSGSSPSSPGSGETS
jgi:uncharacterized protein (DUF2062 family)